LTEGNDEKAHEANRRLMIIYDRLVDELRQGEPPLLEAIEEAHFDEVEGVQLQLAGRRVRVIAGNEAFHPQVKKALAVLDAVERRDLATLELFRISDAERLFGSRPIRYINTKSPSHLIVGLAQ
jgi:hypothetical protein